MTTIAVILVSATAGAALTASAVFVAAYGRLLWMRSLIGWSLMAAALGSVTVSAARIGQVAAPPAWTAVLTIVEAVGWLIVAVAMTWRVQVLTHPDEPSSDD